MSAMRAPIPRSNTNNGKILVAPSGLIRNDASFEDQVKEYNERRAQLNRHRELIEKLRREREASRSPQRAEGTSKNEAVAGSPNHLFDTTPLRQAQHPDASPHRLNHSGAQEPPTGKEKSVTNTEPKEDSRSPNARVHNRICSETTATAEEEPFGVSCRTSEGQKSLSKPRSDNSSCADLGECRGSKEIDGASLLNTECDMFAQGGRRRSSSVVFYTLHEDTKGSVEQRTDRKDPRGLSGSAMVSREISFHKEGEVSKEDLVAEEILVDEPIHGSCGDVSNCTQSQHFGNCDERTRVADLEILNSTAVPPLPLPKEITDFGEEEARASFVVETVDVVGSNQAHVNSGEIGAFGLVDSRPPTAPNSGRRRGSASVVGVRRHVFVLNPPWSNGIGTTTPRGAAEHRREKAKLYIHSLFMSHLTSKGLLKNPFDDSDVECDE